METNGGALAEALATSGSPEAMRAIELIKKIDGDSETSDAEKIDIIQKLIEALIGVTIKVSGDRDSWKNSAIQMGVPQVSILKALLNGESNISVPKDFIYHAVLSMNAMIATSLSEAVSAVGVMASVEVDDEEQRRSREAITKIVKEVAGKAEYVMINGEVFEQMYMKGTDEDFKLRQFGVIGSGGSITSVNDKEIKIDAYLHPDIEKPYTSIMKDIIEVVEGERPTEERPKKAKVTVPEEDDGFGDDGFGDAIDNLFGTEE